MSAALIDLVAKGAQDAYITGDPQVSFFRQNYKRHTNFAIKPERIDYIGTFGDGNEVTIPIRSKGDLLSYVWIESNDITMTNDNASGLFSGDVNDTTEFTLTIGGQDVCKLDAFFIQGVHNIMYKDNSSKSTCSTTTTEKSDNARGAGGPASGSDYFVIPFFFSEDWTKSLPLVALQYHAVEIRVKCRSGFVPSVSPKVFGTYIFLDTEEREHFVNTEHELLITQTQYQPMNSTDTDIDLTYFNHPIKAVHIVSTPPVGSPSGKSWDELYKFDTATMYINGTPLFENMSSTFYHNVVPEMHTTNLTSSVLDTAPLYTWPLCLTINKPQPSGTLNFSRIDNAKISLTNPLYGGLITRAYAVNYNILRIKNGMAGVAFGN